MSWIDVPEAPTAVGRRAAQARASAQAAQVPRWYAINNATSPDEAEVLLYDSIGGWFGIYADEFLAELRAVTAPNIRLRINSPGGSVFEGVAIANALRAHPAQVTVQVDGLAASIASVIAMAGDRVEMAPNSMLMIHEASGACMGDAAEMEKMAEVLGLISTNIANAYAARAGGEPADWRAAMRAETWYLPDAAVAAGLADVALSAVPESTAEPDEGQEEDDDEDGLMEARMRAQFDLAAYGYVGPPRPKPAPPTHARATGEQPATLVISIADLLDEDIVTRLRAAIKHTATDPAATAAPVHHTATVDTSWDAGAQEKKLDSPMTVATAKAMYGWYDSAQVDGGKLPKSACKLPHHEVSADGTPGAANLPGVRNALARLSQSDIPEVEQDAVKRHLQAHLDDAAKDDDADDQARLELRGEHGPELAGTAPDAAIFHTDTWAASIAHLTTPTPDPWAAAIAHLTTPASPAATDA